MPLLLLCFCCGWSLEWNERTKHVFLPHLLTNGRREGLEFVVIRECERDFDGVTVSCRMWQLVAKKLWMMSVDRRVRTENKEAADATNEQDEDSNTYGDWLVFLLLLFSSHLISYPYNIQHTTYNIQHTYSASCSSSLCFPLLPSDREMCVSLPPFHSPSSRFDSWTQHHAIHNNNESKGSANHQHTGCRCVSSGCLPVVARLT